MADAPLFTSGLSELVILRLLKNREMYGYEIVQAIALGTGRVLTPGEGVVYPLLHGLEKAGALKSRRKSVNGRSRVYYALTAKGLKRLDRLAAQWTAVGSAVEAMLVGHAHAV